MITDNYSWNASPFAVFAVYKWCLKKNQQDVEIERVKSEQCLLTYGMLACLKGRKEQGCNDSVTEAIDKIEKHINSYCSLPCQSLR